MRNTLGWCVGLRNTHPPGQERWATLDIFGLPVTTNPAGLGAMHGTLLVGSGGHEAPMRLDMKDGGGDSPMRHVRKDGTPSTSWSHPVRVAHASQIRQVQEPRTDHSCPRAMTRKMGHTLHLVPPMLTHSPSDGSHLCCFFCRSRTSHTQRHQCHSRLHIHSGRQAHVGEELRNHHLRNGPRKSRMALFGTPLCHSQTASTHRKPLRHATDTMDARPRTFKPPAV